MRAHTHVHARTHARACAHVDARACAHARTHPHARRRTHACACAHAVYPFLPNDTNLIIPDIFPRQVVGVARLIMTLLGVDFMTAIGSVAASLGNVGPGIGSVGPDATYSSIPIAGKWFLSLLMFIGRLELFTFLMILTPAFWRHN